MYTTIKLSTFFFLMMVFALTGWGQKYITSKIKIQGDSILRVCIGDSLFYNNTVYNTNTCYRYVTWRGRSEWEELTKFEKTKGKFKEVEMRWFIIIPNSYCPEYDTIKGMVSIVFDSILQAKTRPDLSFIPEFYLNKDSCYLISEGKALSIAKRLYLKTGIGSPEAILKYKPEIKTFIWEVRQTLTIDIDNDRSFDVVDLDAHSGELILHHFLYEDTQY